MYSYSPLMRTSSVHSRQCSYHASSTSCHRPRRLSQQIVAKVSLGRADGTGFLHQTQTEVLKRMYSVLCTKEIAREVFQCHSFKNRRTFHVLFMNECLKENILIVFMSVDGVFSYIIQRLKKTKKFLASFIHKKYDFGRILYCTKWKARTSNRRTALGRRYRRRHFMYNTRQRTHTGSSQSVHRNEKNETPPPLFTDDRTDGNVFCPALVQFRSKHSLQVISSYSKSIKYIKKLLCN